MNRKNIQTALLKARDKAAHLRNRVGAGALVAMASLPAFAQDDNVDTAAIMAKWAIYSAAAITLIIGFAGILWAIRGASLLKPKS